MHLRSFAIVLVLSMLTAPAAAQHTAEVAQVQTLATCVQAQHTQLARLVRLIDEARGRLTATDATVRHDAELSIDTLLQRAAEARTALSACIAAANFTPPSGETVERVTTPDDAADHVAASGGSIHEVESDAAVSVHVRVVRGERVDGSGSATDAAVRSAVHGTGPAISVCYESYVDRVSSRSGTVHVSFTVTDGGHVADATVERGGFDTELRQCVQRAFRTLAVTGAHGRSVYGYEIALGE
jgi:hypothetical protein